MSKQNLTPSHADIHDEFDEIDFVPTGDGRTDFSKESGVANEGQFVTPNMTMMNIADLEAKWARGQQVFFLKSRSLQFEPVDPLGDGLGIDIAHEQSTPATLEFQRHVDVDYLTRFWSEVQRDMHSEG